MEKQLTELLGLNKILDRYDKEISDRVKAIVSGIPVSIANTETKPISRETDNINRKIKNKFGIHNIYTEDINPEDLLHR